MKWLIIGLTFFSYTVSAQEVPYISADEFDFKLDYTFETKPKPSNDKVNLMEESSYSPTPLPYVRVSFTFNEFPDDAYRVKVSDNNGASVISRKINKLDVLEFDLGFSDDIKDRVEPHIFYIYIESKDRERLSMVKIFVEQSGDFYLNDKLFGKI